MRTLVFACLTMVAACAQAAVAWRNLDESSHQGGRKASEGYLQGKIVLVCRDSSLAERMEAVWQSFKTKPFVLLGTFAAANGTFPQYRGAGLASGEPDAPIYVVGGHGRVVYKGSDERQATEAAVAAMTDLEAPRTVFQWKAFLDYEFETLPGQAYLRYLAFRKKFPAEAKAYDEKAKALNAIKDIKKLADLVAFAKKAKDTPAFDAKKKNQKQKFVTAVKTALFKYAALKDHEDPLFAQEAKNALADLKWTQAAL